MRKDLHSAAPMPQVMATLYFGANVPGREMVLVEEPMTGALMPVASGVSDAEFARFIRDSITPRFPGFTLAKLQGYWKGEPELMRVVTTLAEDDSSFRTSIRILAEHYKSDFRQEAVAYSFAPVEFTLNHWPYGPVGAYHKAGKGY